jgi:hypothetical protein
MTSCVETGAAVTVRELGLRLSPAASAPVRATCSGERTGSASTCRHQLWAPDRRRADLESDIHLVRVILWGSGEVALTVLDVAHGAVVCEEHRKITSRQGVVNTLRDAAAWIAS